MVNSSRRLCAIAAVAMAVLVNSCGGSSPSSSAITPTAPTAPTITTLVLSGWLQPLRAGDTVQLAATAIYSDGTNRVVTSEATWVSSNRSVATVQAGLVTTRAEGFASITAWHSGRSANQDLSVERGDVPAAGLACGVERWAVKTLSDAAASSVDVSRVRMTTIKALNELPTRCSGLPNTRAFAEEFALYEVVGRIIFVRNEDDRDYHVAVADPSDSSYTIVTEVADPACSGAINSPHREAISTTRASFLNILAGRSPSALVGTTVRLRGVGFYDFNHGQIGRSRNCLELHPLVSFNRAE